VVEQKSLALIRVTTARYWYFYSQLISVS